MEIDELRGKPSSEDIKISTLERTATALGKRLKISIT